MKYTLLSDEALIKQFNVDQHPACFTILYNRYMNRVYRLCLRLTRQPETAHDFTQDVFVKIFCKLDHFKFDSSFSTWIYAITFNYCVDRTRLKRHLIFDQLLESFPQLPAMAEDDTFETRMAYLVEAVDEDELLLLKLKYEHGMLARDIAKQYNISEPAVKMRLKRIRDRVQTGFHKAQQVR